jgi:conjugal transfer pilus assembly protein TraW
VNCRIFFPVIALVLLATPAWGIVKYLGVVGKTYPVVEPDIILEMKQKMANQEQLDSAMLRNRLRDYKPADLQQLPKATKDNQKIVDMTYTLPADLLYAEGKVIYPKGFTFNPLDYVTFRRGLVILDGNDSEQLRWFENSPYYESHQAMLLITDGSAYDLISQLQRPVFYLTQDIATRLRLAAVPSIVIQEQDKMQIFEFEVKSTNTDSENRNASE